MVGSASFICLEKMHFGGSSVASGGSIGDHSGGNGECPKA